MSQLFAHDSIWNKSLADNAPIDPTSDALIAELAREVRTEVARGIGPWVVAGARYVVPASQPTVPVKLLNSNGVRANLAAAFAAVPLPPDAIVDTGDGGNDRALSLYQLDTDNLWEFYQLTKDALGNWSTAWGGAMHSASTNPGYYNADCWLNADAGWGSTATSLPLCAGMITVADAQAGVIPHAIAVNLPWAKPGVFAWPAQRTDGSPPGASQIPEGAHIRIDPTLDLSTLSLSTGQLAVARALQRYGMVVRDQTHTAVGFVVEDARQYKLTTDPLTTLFGSRLFNSIFGALPWDRMQVLQMELHH